MQAVTREPNAAEALLSEARFGEAADAAASVLANDPGNVLMLCVMALAERGQGRPVDAMRNCTDALRFDPSSAWAYSIRALLYLEANCLVESERDASRAAQIDADWAEPLMLRARSLARMRRYGEARMCVHQALAIDSDVEGAKHLLKLIGAVEAEDSEERRRLDEQYDKQTASMSPQSRRSARALLICGLIVAVAVGSQIVMFSRFGLQIAPFAALWLAVVVALRSTLRVVRPR